MMIGGWSGYQAIFQLNSARKNFPAFNIPIVCVPATINNNLPGAELAVGADTALNTIVEALDKIKHSSDSTRRAFIVEVMGRYCGYLAMMSGLASGAEYIYLHENGVTLQMLEQHVNELKSNFLSSGRHVALMIRNEKANPTYSTSFICDLFQEAGDGVFDIRKVILGSMQQGGVPSPFDRIQGVRLAFEALSLLEQQLNQNSHQALFIGHSNGKISTYNITDLPKMVADEEQRPNRQWWESLYDIAMALAKKKK
jgi:6-phosphofructokinase 1